MHHITRKKHTGQAGNKGEFGNHNRPESDVTLSSFLKSALPSFSEPRWKTKSRKRTQNIAAFREVASALRDRNAGIADTQKLVTGVLKDVLGHDQYDNYTTLGDVRKTFADEGIRNNGIPIGAVIVKPAGEKLLPQHMQQIDMFNDDQSAELTILTNGCEWKVYRLTADRRHTDVELVLDFSITDDDEEASAQALQLLSVESLRRREIEKMPAKD
jgi:hypothetical protein